MFNRQSTLITRQIRENSRLLQNNEAVLSSVIDQLEHLASILKLGDKATLNELKDLLASALDMERALNKSNLNVARLIREGSYTYTEKVEKETAKSQIKKIQKSLLDIIFNALTLLREEFSRKFIQYVYQQADELDFKKQLAYEFELELNIRKIKIDNPTPDLLSGAIHAYYEYRCSTVIEKQNFLLSARVNASKFIQQFETC